MIPQLVIDLVPYVADLGSDEHDGAFWSIEDDDELEAFLFGNLFPGLDSQLSDEQWADLPRGYRPLVTVLEFEQHCQFEGWTAVENHAQEMSAIVDAYEFLGLLDEARALSAVDMAYRNSLADDSVDANDAMARAYRSVPNSTPDIEHRIPVILEFVRRHPEHFRE